MDGNTNGSERYIGTNDNFDFPIRTNGVEVGRFTTDGRLFMGRTVADNGSNAGFQYTSLVANRAQTRLTQYGANAGVPGISTLKSRGATIGTLAPVAVGDVIFGITAVGVTDNLSIPLSGVNQCVVSSVPAAAGWIGTEWIWQDVSKNGPANGRRTVFKIDSEGVPHLYEQNTVMAQLQDGTAGLATLDGAGNATVPNVNTSVTSRITLTIQDGTGVVPTGFVYVSARVAGTSFTISSVGGNPAGVVVYWQIWERAP